MADETADKQTSVAPLAKQVEPLSRDIIKAMAMDIGKEVASHIETMYPQAVEATSKSMLLSVRNCVFNQIMAALETVDEDEIRQRLEARKAIRRKQRAAFRKLRGQSAATAMQDDN